MRLVLPDRLGERGDSPKRSSNYDDGNFGMTRDGININQKSPVGELLIQSQRMLEIVVSLWWEGSVMPEHRFDWWWILSGLVLIKKWILCDDGDCGHHG